MKWHETLKFRSRLGTNLCPPHPAPLQVWSLDVNASCTRLVTGASDNQLRVWALDREQGRGGGGDGAAAGMAVDGEEAEEEEGGSGGRGGEGEDDVVAVYMGSVARQGNGEGFNFSTFLRAVVHTHGSGRLVIPPPQGARCVVVSCLI